MQTVAANFHAIRRFRIYMIMTIRSYPVLTAPFLCFSSICFRVVRSAQLRPQFLGFLEFLWTTFMRVYMHAFAAGSVAFLQSVIGWRESRFPTFLKMNSKKPKNGSGIHTFLLGRFVGVLIHSLPVKLMSATFWCLFFCLFS
jgi:hypothetical protein